MPKALRKGQESSARMMKRGLCRVRRVIEGEGMHAAESAGPFAEQAESEGTMCAT